MTSKVFFSKIKNPSKASVISAVRELMVKADWSSQFSGKRPIFVKINSMSDTLVPSQNTNPWVVEGVLQGIREKYPKREVAMGDADLATVEQLERAANIWGFRALAKKYDVKFVNLSKEKTVERRINGYIFKELNVPKIVMESDVITVPVMKTHCITKLTASLKNQWGCVPRFRHQYHTVADKAIADINKVIPVKFALIDGTISMEENGPKTGIPKVCNVLFASKDRVAADSAVARYMGFRHNEVRHILYSEKSGVGTQDFKIVGKGFRPQKFIKPELEKHVIFKWEFKIRNSPLAPLFFRTKLFDFFAWGVTQYNTTYWYNKKGKKYLKEICKNTNYCTLFEPLMKKSMPKFSYRF
jgi:uncharacterized protein (DUF362 family)